MAKTPLQPGDGDLRLVARGAWRRLQVVARQVLLEDFKGLLRGVDELEEVEVLGRDGAVLGQGLQVCLLYTSRCV